MHSIFNWLSGESNSRALYQSRLSSALLTTVMSMVDPGFRFGFDLVCICVGVGGLIESVDGKSLCIMSVCVNHIIISQNN